MSRRPPFDIDRIEDPDTLCKSLPDRPNHNPRIDNRVEYPEGLEDFRDLVAGHCRQVIQESAEDHPLLTFAYNAYADNGFSNDQFIGYEQDTVICLMGHLIESRARRVDDRIIRRAAIECFNLGLLSMLGIAERDGYFDDLYDREVEEDLEVVEDSAKDAEFFMNVFADELARERDRRDDYDDYDDREPVRGYRTGGNRTRRYPTGGGDRGASRDRRSSNDRRSGGYGSSRVTGRSSSSRSRSGVTTNVPSTRFPNKPERSTTTRKASTTSRSALYGGPSRQATQTNSYQNTQAQPATQNVPNVYLNKPGITWKVDPNDNTLPYGTILGYDTDGVPIVKCRQRTDTVGAMVQEEDMLGDGPVDVVKFGDETAVRHERANTMANDIGLAYDRSSRTATLFGKNKTTTRYGVEEPTQTDKFETPKTVSDIVIDPFYYGLPEDEERPYDHFYNPGGIEIWSRQAFFKRASGKLKDLFNRPLRAFNPYEEVAFIAVWPGDKPRMNDIIVERADGMEYLTHELRAELRNCKRIADSETIINEAVPTFKAIAGKASKQLDVSDESVRTVRIHRDSVVMSPINALTSVECTLAQSLGDVAPENYIFNSVEPLDFVQVGVDKPRIFASIKNCKTFTEVADRMVEYAEDGLLDEANFCKLDELFKTIVNRALNEQYACSASIASGFFVDAINDASKYVEGLYGEKGKVHWAKYQRAMIEAVFNFEDVPVVGKEELAEEESVKEEDINDEHDNSNDTEEDDGFFSDDNIAEYSDVEKDVNDGIDDVSEIDERIKEEYEAAEKRVHLLRSELTTTNLRIELSSQAFTSINLNVKEGGQVLPKAHYKNLCKLIHLIKQNQPKSIAYNIITTDGVIYRAYIGIDDVTVILALAS